MKKKERGIFRINIGNIFHFNRYKLYFPFLTVDFYILV